jgi:hypothetical protein
LVAAGNRRAYRNGVPQRVPLVLSLLFVVLLGPGLASGSSVDPTWIAGFWDAADHDEDLLAVAGLEGIGDPGGSTILASDLPVVGLVRCVAPNVGDAAPSARPAIRAPPAASLRVSS